MKHVLVRGWLSLLAWLAPAVALAQTAGEGVGLGDGGRWGWGWGWLWLGLAALFLIALFAVWIPGRRRRHPPRTP